MLKTLDEKGRWRNVTVAFRMSLEESADLNARVRLSGLTKQDYIIRRLQCRDVIVQGSSRVYKALRNELAAILVELKRIEAGEALGDELMDTIDMIVAIMGGMKEDA